LIRVFKSVCGTVTDQAYFMAQLSLVVAVSGRFAAQRLGLKLAGFPEPSLARRLVGSLVIVFLGFVSRSDADKSVNRRTADDCGNYNHLSNTPYGL
jgi:hypothetical protein